MTTARGPAECWLIDMDGVLVHENRALPGAAEFLARLVERDRRFLVLTNNSIFTPRDLAARLAHSNLTVPETSIWTSALATADFLSSQMPGGSAYVIGETGLTTALHEAGYTQTETNPDYVVLGETRTFSFTQITKAIRLVKAGARFIATNPDATSPSAEGPLPATGSVAAMITKATGAQPYFAGKQLQGSSGSAGPSVTGGGLVFVGATSDRRVRAFDSTTGKELWQAKLTGEANSNPISFGGKTGKQFVAVNAGGVITAYGLP